MKDNVVRIDSYNHRQWSLSHDLQYLPRNKGPYHMLDRYEKIYNAYENAFSIPVEICSDGTLRVKLGNEGGYNPKAGSGEPVAPSKSMYDELGIMSYSEWVKGAELRKMLKLHRQVLSYFDDDVIRFEQAMESTRMKFVKGQSMHHFDKVRTFYFDQDYDLHDMICTCCYIAELLRVHTRQHIRPAILCKYKGYVCDFMDEFQEVVFSYIEDFAVNRSPFGVGIIWTYFDDQLSFDDKVNICDCMYPKYNRPLNDPRMSKSLRNAYREYVQDAYLNQD